MRRLKDKKPHIRTHKGSLTRQITTIFVCIMTLTIFVCWLINSFFLEKFYLLNKEKSLLLVYNSMCAAAMNNTTSTDDFALEMERYVGKYNVSIVLVNSLFEPIQVYSNEPQNQLFQELKDNIWGDVQLKSDSIILQNDSYVMVRKMDRRTQSDFLEMWGLLPDSGFFMMRVAMEGIRDSVSIANRFLLYIGGAAIVFSGLIIYFFTKKISKPVLELAKISEKMTDMDFDAKYSGKSNNEIGLLGHNINRLSESLESTILDLKKANLELKRDNERKTEVDEMRKEFLSNVSHELKTPIALIQGYAEGLKEGVNEEDERDYYCDVIMDEASKMNSMVKNLLTLNQLEFGSDNVSMERFDITSLVSTYLKSSDLLAKQNDIRVILKNIKPIYVWADEFKVEEVLMNYFSNAVIHCASDTEKRIEVSMELNDNVVKVSVFNTGENIPEESIPHLWEKFYKVDKARTREYGGSGVGLSIVKAIMDSMGQTCGVNNVTDGVTFWFTLDASETKREE